MTLSQATSRDIIQLRRNQLGQFAPLSHDSYTSPSMLMPLRVALAQWRSANVWLHCLGCYLCTMTPSTFTSAFGYVNRLLTCSTQRMVIMITPGLSDVVWHSAQANRVKCHQQNVRMWPESFKEQQETVPGPSYTWLKMMSSSDNQAIRLWKNGGKLWLF